VRKTHTGGREGYDGSTGYDYASTEEYDAILQAQNDAQTNELNAVEDKYNTLIAKAAEYGFDEIELNRLKNEEIAKVNKKYDDEDSDDDLDISADAFLDVEAGQKITSVIKSMTSKVSQLEKKLEEANSKLNETEKRHQRAEEDNLRTSANQALLNETVGMAKQFDSLKDIPNLEKEVDKFLQGKNEDPIFVESIGKIFDEVKAAKKRGETISLKTAFKMLKADDSDLLIREAESRGRKSVYQEHQPSKNLSQVQKGGDSTQFRNYSDDEIQGFIDDPDSIPDSFFDENFNPLPKDKLPKKIQKLFY